MWKLVQLILSQKANTQEREQNAEKNKWVCMDFERKHKNKTENENERHMMSANDIITGLSQSSSRMYIKIMMS